MIESWLDVIEPQTTLVGNFGRRPKRGAHEKPRRLGRSVGALNSYLIVGLKQAADLSVVVDVDQFGRWRGW